MPPPFCGDDRVKIANQIKCFDGRDKPAATPHIGREQRELALSAITDHRNKRKYRLAVA